MLKAVCGTCQVLSDKEKAELQEELLNMESLQRDVCKVNVSSACNQIPPLKHQKWENKGAGTPRILTWSHI